MVGQGNGLNASSIYGAKTLPLVTKPATEKVCAFGRQNAPGTTGLVGIPTVAWTPTIQSPGINAGNEFGFIVTGTNNFTFVVEACTNLAGAAWTPLATNTLVNGTYYFSDGQWTNYPVRFYGLAMP